MPSASTLAGSRAASTCSRTIASRRSTVPPHDDNLFQHYRDPVIELGGDVTRPLAGGAIKFVALATRRKRDDVDTTSSATGCSRTMRRSTAASSRPSEARRNETIGRLSWTRANLLGLSFEAGAEAAYNTLDDHVDLFAIDENGEHVPIDLPIADATVKEKRGEVYVNVGKNAVADAAHRRRRQLRILEPEGERRCDRRSNAEVPEAEPDARLEAGRRLAHPVFDPPHRRPARFLRFHQRRRSCRRNRVTGSNADLQPQRAWEFRAHASNIRCSATACSSSISGTTWSACSRTRS